MSPVAELPGRLRGRRCAQADRPQHPIIGGVRHGPGAANAALEGGGAGLHERLSLRLAVRGRQFGKVLLGERIVDRLDDPVGVTRAPGAQHQPGRPERGQHLTGGGERLLRRWGGGRVLRLPLLVQEQGEAGGGIPLAPGLVDARRGFGDCPPEAGPHERAVGGGVALVGLRGDPVHAELGRRQLAGEGVLQVEERDRAERRVRAAVGDAPGEAMPEQRRLVP